MNHDVFISYSSLNSDVALAVCEMLEQNGIACWIAPRDIPGGASYGDIIEEAIKSSRVVVVLFSLHAAISGFVCGELNIAFDERKTIIPFRLDETPLKGLNRLILNHFQWIDAYPCYETKFDDLAIAIRQIIDPPPSQRRLPIYLLLDTSVSMYGEPIEAVKKGVQTLVSTLRCDPYALETAYISIITFNNSAQQVVPLTELAAFQYPKIAAYGCTALGEALCLLARRIDDEVRKTTFDRKGDWSPLAFIMTDGKPTDDLMSGIGELKKRKFGIIVGCAAGKDAQIDVLKRITTNIVKLSDTNSSTIKAFFKWVSASISLGSKRVEEFNGELTSMSDLPEPPIEVIIVE